MSDQDLMPFGKHKDKNMENVPADYLLWLYDEWRKVSDNAFDCNHLSVFAYIEEHHNTLVGEQGDYIPQYKPSR